MHLREEEFVDLVEAGSAAAPLQEHLQSCAACRERLADLRATLQSVKAVDVPDPSPLFWDHFSRRVRGAVAADAAGRPGRGWLPWLFPAAAAASLILLVVAPGVWRSARWPATSIAVAPAAPAAPVRDTLGEVTDPSLTFVADLTDGAGWEATHEAGLSPRGSAEHAVTHLSEPELRELQRLLQTELAHVSD
jgi:hypothetical protein